MSVRKIGQRLYISFKWRGNRIEAVTSAKNEAEAKKIEKSVKTAFKIYRFDHLQPSELEVVVRIFENRGWKLPPELEMSEPQHELTLIKAIEDYLKADDKHRVERNLFAIDRLVEHFGENFPFADLKVPQIRQYRKARLENVQNATVNRELSVLSGIFRVQLEYETLEFNPCKMLDLLPENQRDTYLSWEDFNRLLVHSWWLKYIITMMYYTGMRFGEVVNLRWEMFKPERRMLILPPNVTKEGKNAKKSKVRPKRVPLRKEAMELLESLRKGQGDNIVRAMGLVFTYTGRYKDHCGTRQGKPIDRFMKRKAWERAVREARLEGLQMRDLRHTWKTNAQRSGIDPTVRNSIVGHSSQRSVEDRYIRVSDEELLKAVDSMTFEHGCTELDLVEEAQSDVEIEKGTEKRRKRGGYKENQEAPIKLSS